MRRMLVSAAMFVFGLAAAALAAPAAMSAEIPVDHLSLPVPRDRQVRLDFPVGELEVEATDEARITFDVTAKCKGRRSRNCEDRVERIRVESETSGGELRLSVMGYPKINAGGLNLRGVLRLPRDLALRVDMNVGALRIAGIEGDLEVDLDVGDADIRTVGRAVRSVDVSTGVGDADVFARGARVRRHGFIGSSASWDGGQGRSSISLNVGVGDATVRVD